MTQVQCCSAGNPGSLIPGCSQKTVVLDINLIMDCKPENLSGTKGQTPHLCPRAVSWACTGELTGQGCGTELCHIQRAQTPMGNGLLPRAPMCHLLVRSWHRVLGSIEPSVTLPVPSKPAPNLPLPPYPTHTLTGILASSLSHWCTPVTHHVPPCSPFPALCRPPTVVTLP